MKKIALLMLVFTLFAGTSVYAQKLKNGTYQGGTTGFDGGVSVKVTVYGREIKDISVYVHRGDGWMDDLINGNHPRYPDGMSPNERKDFEENSALLKKEGPRYTSAQDFADAIVKNQSTVIDVMSGATVTCEAVIEAVHEALRSKNRDVVSAWEQEGYQKRLATAQRRNKLKAEERQRIAKAEAEKKRQEEATKKRAEEAEAERQRLAKEAEEERQRLEEEARQQRIAEALKQPTVTPAASEFKYDLADGTYGGVKIIKYLGNAMSIKIPEKIEGLAVTEIEKGTFDKNTLVKIVIPGTVKKMMSFSGFTMLSEVTIGDGMAEITGASYKRNKYDEITDKVYEGVFEGCTNLNKVTIGKGVAAIPERCFAGCTNLSEIIIPNSVESIEAGAFAGSGLTSIVIPDSVKSISEDAFMNCVKLKSVKLPMGIRRIYIGTFANTALTSIIIPDSVDFIAPFAFYECKSLESVTLPASLRLVRGGAFVGCSSLSEIKIPASLKTVEFERYSLDRNYYTIHYIRAGKGDEYYFSSVYYIGNDGRKYSEGYDAGYYYYYNNDKSVKYYENSAFVGCSSLSLATKSKLRELGYSGEF